MSCFHPNGFTFLDGQPSRFIGQINSERVAAFESEGYEVVPIPCGKCIGCRLDRSKMWADRMLLEYSMDRETYPARTALFLTVTYDDEHIPWIECTDGVMRHNLEPRDMQLFMKDLRQWFWNHRKKRLRFYLCGEYGSTTFRSHYHIILFGAALSDFDDLKIYSFSPFAKDGDGTLYASPTLDKIWNRGAIRFSVASYATFSYVGRYVLKKQYMGDDSVNIYRGRLPPFTRMSLRPGIGLDYFSGDTSVGTKVSLCDGSTVHEIGLPRRVLDKIELTDPELYARLKEQRRYIARGYNDMLRDTLSMDYFDYLRNREFDLIGKSSSLKRK